MAYIPKAKAFTMNFILETIWFQSPWSQVLEEPKLVSECVNAM